MIRPMRALVVDDHPLMASATKKLLSDIEGVEVIGVAGNAEQCREQVKQYQPGLVFLDYQLPDQPGTEVAEWIRQYDPNVRIVVFTGIEVRLRFFTR